ncbi:hypothetical protein SK128_010882 [Halocaridina rubra]|uniref:Uncharacterized protein n=1 Tax=Halocaridina rubra TaxID=373956 RepID=A0AAN8WPT3_HALRR
MFNLLEGFSLPIRRCPCSGGRQPVQPQPPTVVSSHSSNLPSKQLKLSCLDEARSADFTNAKPACYHCTSQEALLHMSQINLKKTCFASIH